MSQPILHISGVQNERREVSGRADPLQRMCRVPRVKSVGDKQRRAFYELFRKPAVPPLAVLVTRSLDRICRAGAGGSVEQLSTIEEAAHPLRQRDELEEDAPVGEHVAGAERHDGHAGVLQIQQLRRRRRKIHPQLVGVAFARLHPQQRVHADSPHGGRVVFQVPLFYPRNNACLFLLLLRVPHKPVALRVVLDVVQQKTLRLLRLRLLVRFFRRRLLFRRRGFAKNQ
mmetsp:Transcript_22200/g.55953  ORF Transcript_22200/g.55953 Transcript_22200/m.55953 type:complete len:228 (-) Transcript_22200:418-1101(-)